MNPERAKRKLSAILSADVKGYCRLMSQDEVFTVSTLKQYLQVMGRFVGEYNGRVVDSPGDNLLAEFDSVVDALDCAVKIQTALGARNSTLEPHRQMVFRIGINLGDVLEDNDRIYGDGINIAARLEGLADPGGICISGTAYDQVKNKLALDYTFLGKQRVKNIPDPVRVYRVSMVPGTGVITDSKHTHNAFYHRRWVAIIALSLLVAGLLSAVVWKMQSWRVAPSVEVASIEKMALPLPEKPSIAVLPFVDISEDPSQEYMADAITENIITTLSYISEMFVIARNSTFTYKNKPVKVQQVSEALGVRYVLEGSVQKAGRRVRIIAQLIDATEGHHLWSERYDRDTQDLFDLLDEISRKVAVALQVELTDGEQARIRHRTTDNLEAWSAVTRGVSLFERFTKDENTKARNLFRHALDLDPTYAFAWTMLSWTHLIEVWLGFSKATDRSIEAAVEHAHKALALDDTQPDVHALLGGIYLLQGQHEKAIIEGQRAVSLGPNHALSHELLAMTMTFAGQSEEAIILAKKAMRLTPYYPAWYLDTLGSAYNSAGRYEEALAAFKKVLDRGQKGEAPALWGHIGLAASYAGLGRIDQAREHAAEVLRLKPEFSLTSWPNGNLYKDPNDRKRDFDLLRKAGLPEKSPLPLPDKPSIAVLPFETIGDDSEQDYFADGITDDLITDLSKISGLFVIARHSVFTYKDKPISIEQIHRELGVRYILEGSLRKAGDRVRINAQLIDGTTGGHLWAERYDREIKDIFSLQDEVTQKIVDALAIKLLPGEQERIARQATQNQEAYDLVLRAWAYFNQYSQEGNDLARQMFTKAIKLDPTYVNAYAGLVWTRMLAWRLGWNQDPRVMEQAFELARKTVDLDAASPKAHALLGDVYLWKKEYNKAIAAFKRAISLDPNDADALTSMASAMTFVGKPDEAIGLLKKAIRLNPYYPQWYIYYLGRANFQAGRYDQALAALKETLLKNPNLPPVHYYLAASYANLGKLDDAREKAEAVKKLRPNFAAEIEKEKSFYENEKYVGGFSEGLRKAGLI